jgi:hypothetical protein
MNSLINRRTVLRGAGVALALPWLASLAPRGAAAAGSTAPKRFLPIFFPNGSSEWWRPAATGSGDAWALSPILQPFQAVKQKMIVLTNLENYSPFAKLAGPAELNPSHGQAPGAFLACVDANVVRDQLKNNTANGITVDQLIAQNAAYSTLTKLQSMQVGLSTVESYCDGRDCSVSRSITWKSATEPTYKDVDPGTIFDNIVGAASTLPPGQTDPEAEKRKALGKSVLDAVLASATRTRARLGAADQKTLDQFMDSVRTVEQNAQAISQGMATADCAKGTKPTLKAQPKDIPTNTADYSKEKHADIMNDLIVMAFQCDVTRIISYMMEDERSEFVYSHVPKRKFAAGGSTPGTNATDTCGNYHGAQHAGSANDDFATINWWQSGKISALAQRLDGIADGDGKTMLDNTVMLYASCMHGGNHQSNDLPVALIGGGSGSLKGNLHVKFPDAIGSDRPMRDLYYTLLQKTFGINVPSFGTHINNLPNSLIAEILA